MTQPARDARVEHGQVVWMPSTGVAWLQNAESRADYAYHGFPSNSTCVNPYVMMWMPPNAVIAEEEGASGSRDCHAWQQTWQATAEAALPTMSESLVNGNLVERLETVNVPWGGALQDSLLLGSDNEEYSEDEKVADAAVTPLPRRRRRRRHHRAGRRQHRAAAHREERRQPCPPTLALVEPRGRYQKTPAADLPSEIQQVQAELAAHCLEQLESGIQEEKQAAIAELHGMVLALSFQSQGCRAVQLAFEISSRNDVEALVEQLHGHVRDAVTSPHANHVVQKAVEVLPSAKTAFVPEELLGAALLTASHRYGCRIMCRIVEHPGSEQRIALIVELLDRAEELCRSVYGRHVISSIMEHGTVQQRKRVVAALHSIGLLSSAKNRHASYVLEKALAFADREDQEALMTELLSDPETIPAMAENEIGCYIVKTLIRNPGKYSKRVFASVSNAAKRVKVTMAGRKLLKELKLLP